MAALLTQLFAGRDLTVAVDLRTNSLAVLGDLAQTVEAILARLDVPVEPKTLPKKEALPPKKAADPLRSRVDAAQADVDMRRERLSWAQRMVKRGYAPETELQAAQAQLHAAETALKSVQAELERGGGAKPK
jgi:multidrug resistance efflux pump